MTKAAGPGSAEPPTRLTTKQEGQAAGDRWAHPCHWFGQGSPPAFRKAAMPVGEERPPPTWGQPESGGGDGAQKPLPELQIA